MGIDGRYILAAGGVALAVWIAKKAKGTNGIGALHYTIKGKVLDYKYRNTSLYGNNSYHVILETPTGIVWAYTAANSQLGYTISNMLGKTVEFDATRRKNGDVVLNGTTAEYDFNGDLRK